MIVGINALNIKSYGGVAHLENILTFANPKRDNFSKIILWASKEIYSQLPDKDWLEKKDEKEFGKILWMRGRYGKSVDNTYYNNWRAKKEFAGGGILIDQGIHMIDLFLYLGGDFDNIHASVSNLYWNLDVEDKMDSLRAFEVF